MPPLTWRAWAGLLLLVLAVSGAQRWWVSHQDDRLGRELARHIREPAELRLLSSQVCAICAQARAWLQAHAVPFTECLIERDAACRADYEALRSPGTPVAIVQGRATLGFSPQRWLQLATAPAGPADRDPGAAAPVLRP